MRCCRDVLARFSASSFPTQRLDRLTSLLTERRPVRRSLVCSALFRAVELARVEGFVEKGRG
jgi:hypothetical protein